jgi:hypothetical protein
LERGFNEETARSLYVQGEEVVIFARKSPARRKLGRTEGSRAFAEQSGFRPDRGRGGQAKKRAGDIFHCIRFTAKSRSLLRSLLR